MWKRVNSLIPILFTILLFTFGNTSFIVASTYMTIETDKYYYTTGDMVRISGNVGTIIPNETVDICIIRADIGGGCYLEYRDLDIEIDGSFYYSAKVTDPTLESGKYRAIADYGIHSVTTYFDYQPVEPTPTGTDIDQMTLDISDVSDISGIPAERIAIGSSYLLGGKIISNSDISQAYVAIMEVRDDEGITTYLQFQKGILSAKTVLEFGISWLPESTGVYEARSFIVTDLKSPKIMSPVDSITIHVE